MTNLKNIMLMPFRFARFLVWQLLWAMRSVRIGEHPSTVHWVNPKDITRLSGVKFDKNWDRGKVLAGDWDQTGGLFEDTRVYKNLRLHFIDGVPWEDTEYYKNLLAQVKEGQVIRGCRTEDELRAKFESFDRLFSDIKQHGYRRNASGSAHNEWKMGGTQTEVMVCIDRNGEMIFGCSGFHRLTIAQLLKVEQIPVLILVRHSTFIHNSRFV